MNEQIAAERLANHRLSRRGPARAADVVSWFGALQAQDYPGAKWGLALRMRDGGTDRRVERAFDEGTILRTHLMRPTWHFVAAADIRWMLDLTRPRVRSALAYAYRVYGLDAGVRARSRQAFERALAADASLTRAELAEHLARAGVPLSGAPLGLAALDAELEGLLCSGPMRGRQFTYALLDRRVPAAARRSRDESLAALGTRYLQSHGPATLRDFVWWSGLTAADARRAFGLCRATPHDIDDRTYWTAGRRRLHPKVDRHAYLLPNFDEFLVAYRDRDGVPRRPGSLGVLQQAIVAGGQILGSWKVIREAGHVALDLTLEPGARRDVTDAALAAAVDRYARFAGVPAVFTVRLRRAG